jgi:hypothetical protein
MFVTFCQSLCNKIKDMCMCGCIIICQIDAVGRLLLKGQCRKIFCSGFYRQSSSPKPQKYIRFIPNFFKNSRRYSQVKVHHRISTTPVANLPPVSMTPAVNLPPVLLLSLILVANGHRYQRNQRQIMGTISELHLNSELQ